MEAYHYFNLEPKLNVMGNPKINEFISLLKGDQLENMIKRGSL
jgi:hypothetical protein